jgi:hypothetical protein
MEKYLNLKAIIACFSLNVIIALIVFSAAYLLIGDAFLTVFYTFISWSLTVSLSVIYWIRYVYKNVTADRHTKKIITLFLLIMLAIMLIIVIFTIGSLSTQ